MLQIGWLSELEDAGRLLLLSWPTPFLLREDPALGSEGPACTGSLRLQLGAFVCCTLRLRVFAPASVLGLLEIFFDPGGLPGFLLVGGSFAVGLAARVGSSARGEHCCPSRERAETRCGLAPLSVAC